MSKAGKIVLGIIVLILIVWLVNPKKQTDASPIRIGFIGPLTGDLSTIGTVTRSAVEIATKEINDSGGINGRMIEMIYEDGKCNASAGANAGQKLINADKVTAIIGGACSGETGAFIKNANDARIPTISYCSSAVTLTGAGPFFSRNYPSDSYVSVFIAEYLYAQGVRKVAALYPITDYGTGLTQAFTERFQTLGGTVVASEGTQQTDREFKTVLSKIKAANPEYIFMTLYTEGGIPAMKQIKELGITVPVIMADTGSDPKFYKNIPQDSEVSFVIADSKLTDDFKSKMLAATGGEEVPICAPQAYDASHILFSALKSVGTDPEKLQAAIRKTEMSGVSGNIKFDDNGDLIGASYKIQKAKNGVVTDVQ